MRILAGGRALFTGRNQCPEFDRPQGPLPGELEVLLSLIDGAERRRQIQRQLNHTQPRTGLQTLMKCALLALWVMAAIVHTIDNAKAQSLEAVLIKSVQAEVHSVVVDMPEVISLPPVSPKAWNTFRDNLPSSIELDEQGPTPCQSAQTRRDPNRFEFLKVNSTANILSGPSASADIIGIAYAGAEVQVETRPLWMGENHRSMVMGDRMDALEIPGSFRDDTAGCRRKLPTKRFVDRCRHSNDSL